MKKNYKIKKTISVKQFISQLGESFSEHMKNRLLELEVRCVLTRKEDFHRLDLKHVEHTQHSCNGSSEKEYVYGQFIVIEEVLYFSEKCADGNEVMEAPIVSTIYNSLSSEGMISDEVSNYKKVDDSNIDYVIDSILTVCPEVSQSYIDIVKEMISHERKRA